ncbi:MAG: transporter related protein, partial [Jatrophihabitans sp.]|nr:transporter related protein [Jatrophihabitans sp.]
RRGGGTVLLSSHLLQEVEVIADELVIISGGLVVAQGSAGELLAEGGISVRALDAVALVACLRSAGLRYQDRADGSFRVDGTAEDVGRAAARDGVVLLELRQPEGAGLEDLFLALTAAQSATGPNGVAA